MLFIRDTYDFSDITVWLKMFGVWLLWVGGAYPCLITFQAHSAEKTYLTYGFNIFFGNIKGAVTLL